ncbi:tRNA lysidine(34) synthetase TilS [Ornithinimicrobium flavum]|uniref:tRNA lysidine(34) synthetase TilS n=1 Tax=Ornithinimicrobium flavum TaxID=1288636 RepID=UPI00106F3430|nr:tRNA lysidine(34) synthetase TilS [Ornithinimicrobium flavum]
MPGPPAAVASTRVAVRRWLRSVGLAPDALVLVACSGGADSLALAAAIAHVAPREGWRAAAVVVDHGLQDGSRQVAHRTAAVVSGLGLPVQVVRCDVGPTAAGPEADARRARYGALVATAQDLGADVVLLGHTRDDQAEQVLLGLLRGSGARSLAGMPPRRALGGVEGNQARRPVGAKGNQTARPVGGGPLLGRPLLGVSRAQTVQACADLGLEPWSDPHNEDPRYTRVRARRVLAVLGAELGRGVVRGLTRTADLLRDDADALDEAAEAAYRGLGEPPWPVAELSALPRAVRTRLWRRLALGAGSPGTDLTREHLLAVDDLVTGWRGQGPLHLPGRVRAGRSGDRVWLRGPA